MAEPWQPLAGLKVVDFAMFIPGPFASAILADLGAEVVKVESLAGDPGRSYVPPQFRTENRNKRSIAVNLKAPEARAVVARLVQLARKAALLVLLQPVVVGKARADLRDGIADRVLLRGEGKIHGPTERRAAPDVPRKAARRSP